MVLVTGLVHLLMSLMLNLWEIWRQPAFSIHMVVCIFNHALKKVFVWNFFVCENMKCSVVHILNNKLVKIITYSQNIPPLHYSR